MKLADMREILQTYDGPELRIMEVCGSHTGAISKNGIRGMLSPKLRLISGPGCPVCVTPTAYVDKLVELAKTSGTCVVCFGDMLRVPGSRYSLSEVSGQGGRAVMVYSPMDIFAMAEKEPDTAFVFAAIGFETTTPIYALLLEEIIERDIRNIKLLTALKTMPGVISYLCEHGMELDGFLAPGHVAAVTGSRLFVPLAEKYQIPFAVAGFEGEEILEALCGIVGMCQSRQHEASSAAVCRAGTNITASELVANYYPSVVTEEGNTKAQAMVDRYFVRSDAVWRGMGMIPGTGMELREEFLAYDAGSRGLNDDHKRNQACCCDKILMGNMEPQQCPLFRKICTPLTPQGACMVSEEGCCHARFFAGE